MTGPTIYVGFSTTTGLLSRLIRKITGSNVSHCFLFWSDDRFGIQFCLTAERGGWLLMEYREFCKSNEVVATFDLAVDLWPGLKRNAQWLGAPYDVGGLLGMTWVEAWWRVGRRRVLNPLDARRRLFCSEIVSKVIRDAGVTLPLATSPGETAPDDLLKALWLRHDLGQIDKYYADLLYNPKTSWLK